MPVGEEPGRIFGEAQQTYRWSRLKNMAPATQFRLVKEEVFPFIKNLHADGASSYARFFCASWRRYARSAQAVRTSRSRLRESP